MPKMIVLASYEDRAWSPKINSRSRRLLLDAVAAVKARRANRSGSLNRFPEVLKFVEACEDFPVAMELLERHAGLHWVHYVFWKLDWQKTQAASEPAA